MSTEKRWFSLSSFAGGMVAGILFAMYVISYINEAVLKTGPYRQDYARKLEQNYSRFGTDEVILPTQSANQSAGSTYFSLDTNRTLIIFLAYKRGGSTFVGDIFNNHPDVFYIFEPVWFEQVKIFGNGYGKGRRSGPLTVMGQKLLENLSLCNYTGERMLNFTLYQKRRQLIPRSRALSKEKGCDDEDLDRRVQKCSSILRSGSSSVSPLQWSKVCKNYNTHVYKVLRLHVTDIVPLLNLPGYNVKILYMIRDPRGILKSRMKVGWHKLAPGTDFPSKLCYDMMDNYVSALWLNLTSDKLKIVKYEEIASDPIKMTKELFEYVGLPYTEEIEKYLKKNSLGDLNYVRKETTMGTYRKDSKSTAEAWKTSLSKSQILMIEQQCGEFLDRAGYEFLYLKNKAYMSLLRNINVLPGIM